MKRKLSLALIVVILLALPTACSTKSTSATNKIQITFCNDFPQPAWVAQIPWIVAKEKGYYDDAGLDVNFVFPATPADPVKYVASGKAQMTATYTADALTAKAEGLNKFIIAGSLMDQDCGGIICFADKGINSPADLKGKKIALYDTPMTRLHFATMMKTYGLSPSDYTVVSAGNYSVPLLASGKVDAADGASPSEMVNLEVQTGKKVKMFYYDKSAGVPDRYWLVLAANSEFAKAHPEAVKAFLKATYKGLEYSQQHPAEAVAIFTKAFPDLDKKTVTADFQNLVDRSYKRFNPDKPMGYMDMQIWNNYMNFLYDNKLLGQKVDISKLVTNDYLN